MLGNLQIFLGPDFINSYAHKLQTLGPLLWVIRLGLLAIIVIHVAATIMLVKENHIANPQAYALKSPRRSTLASRTMILSGLTVLAFIVFHLLHFTVRVVPGHEYNESIILASGEEVPAHVELDKKWGLTLHPVKPHEAHNTHGMMIAGFSYWHISAVYVVAIFLLCVHLSHGASSLFQTLGWRNQHFAHVLDGGSRMFAWALFAGYVLIPIAVLLRWLKP